jgi:outer membrane protein assembly factor BamB
MSQKIIYSTFILLCLLSCSCRKDGKCIRINTIGEVLWSTSLHENDEFYSNSIIKGHLVYDDKVILATTRNTGGRYLSGYNVYTGEHLWDWRDVFEEIEYMDIFHAYFFNNKVSYTMGSRQYCINLEDGSTFWKVRRNDSYNSIIDGIEGDFFIRGNPIDTFQGYRSQAFFQGNMQNGDLEQVMLPNAVFNTGGEDGLITGLSKFTPFVHNGTRYILANSSHPYPQWNYNVMIGLYNLDAESWVYDTIEIKEPTQGNTVSNIYVVNEKIYISAGNRIACRDLWTGAAIWQKNFPLDFMFSGFIVEDGRVIANCENSVLYGLDAETGATIWEGRGAGTSSYLKGRYLNGVVYFYGGSTGDIHAVDCETGETLWQVDDSKTPDGHLWKPDIYVVPGQNGEKGRVVLCTSMHAYCVEAIR